MPSGERERNNKVALAWQAITLKVPYGVLLTNTVMVQRAVTNFTVRLKIMIEIKAEL